MDVHISRELSVSAEEVWQVVGERFDDLTWAPLVTASAMEGVLGVGAVRVCRFPPIPFATTGRICERLLEFNRESRTLTYQAVDAPGIMNRAVNRWTVTPISAGRCRVDLHATIELRGVARVFTPIVRMFIRRMSARTFDRLADHVAVVRARSAA